MFEILGRNLEFNTKYRFNNKKLKNYINYVGFGGSLDNCQEGLDSEITTSNKWLSIIKLLQNIKGKNIATLLGNIKEKDVIIKVQRLEEAKNEFMVWDTIVNRYKLKGFAEYYCIAECGNSIDYLDTFSNAEQNNTIKDAKICSIKGNKLGIVIMKYYRHGSLEYLLGQLKDSKKKKLYVILVSKLLMNTVFNAYISHKYIHGDLFPKNIVLDDRLKPILIDYELSKFSSDNNLDLFWKDIVGYFDNSQIYIYFDNNLSLFLMKQRGLNKKPSIKLLEELTDLLDSYK